MSKTYYSGSDTGVGFAVPADPKSITDGLDDEQIKARVVSESEKYQLALRLYQKQNSVVARKTESAKKLSDTIRNNADNIWKKSSDGLDTNLIRSFGEAIASVLSLYDLSPDDMGNEVRSLYELTQSDELRSGDMALVASKADNAMEAIVKIEEQAKKVPEYEKAMSDMLTAQRNYQMAVNDAMRAKVKSDSRLLESVGKDVDIRSMTTVPPNYQLSDGDSPRQCKTCKFFERMDSDTGHCTIYNRTVKANYICDVWQSKDLTPIHTPVRKISRKEYAETQGQVWATSQEIGNGDVWVTDVIDYNKVDDRHTKPFPDNDISRAVLKDFLPSDTVYLKSMRSLGRIESLVEIDGLTIYSVKLMDTSGNTTGYAYTYSDDMQARSSKAVKRIGGIEPSRRYKSLEDDLEQMIKTVRDFYKALDTICSEHSDLRTKPLDNTNVLTPLRDAMLTELENPLFDNVATGKRRKYFRALQSAMTSVGASRLILFEAFKLVNILSKTSGEKSVDDQRNVMIKAQQDAYDRLDWARKMLYDALMLPSATHGDDAPQYKKIRRRVKADEKGISQLLSQNSVPHDSVTLDGDYAIVIGSPVSTEVGANKQLESAVSVLESSGYKVWESYVGMDSSRFSFGEAEFKYMIRMQSAPELSDDSTEL